MSKVITEKLERAFILYDELLKFLPESELEKKLPNLPSNQLGQQLWCVVGARRSYLNALKAGKWLGFECPLSWENAKVKKEVLKSLQNTAKDLTDFLKSDQRYSESIALDLLEHETQHHGQIIRYLYGLNLGVPDSWKKRYNLK